LLEQLGPNRHCDFSSGGRRRRTQVGGVVDQRRIGFVPHRGDQRNRRFCGGSDDFLLVEGPQVLDRSAATGDDQQVGPRGPRRKAADGLGDSCGGALTLHGDGPQNHARRATILQAVEDVADHRSRWRRHHADHLG
jgi:hypothetical protein